jgi:16S rRNA (guanine527-N7)-methyltransferase
MAVPAWFAEALERELRRWLPLSNQQVKDLYIHYEFLERWNERINLTTVKPGIDMVTRHYCESLFLGVHMPVETDEARIADIGSGAGFPGVPIAILRPSWQVTLIESVQRKAVFLREATRHLKNIHVLAGRAEEVSGAFDWLVSRAVHPRDLLAQVPRLAPRVGLLLGEGNFKVLESFTTIAWSEPIRLPWGDRRLCVFGSFHVEQSRSEFHGTESV